MSEGLAKLLQALSIDDPMLAEYGTMDAIDVDPVSNEWHFHFRFAKPVPLLRYRQLIEGLKRIGTVYPSVKSVSYETVLDDYQESDVMEYFDFVLDEMIAADPRVTPVKDYPADIRSGELRIKAPLGARSAVMFRNGIEAELAKNGFTVRVAIDVDEEKKPIVDEIVKSEQGFVRKSEAEVVSPRFNVVPLYADKPIGGDFTKISAIPIDEIALEEYKNKHGKANFAIQGRVASIETRPGRNGGEANIIMADGSDSMLVKKRLSNPEDNSFVADLKPGCMLAASGFVMYDKYYGETALTATNLAKSAEPMPKSDRADRALDKRVELHLHTKMSALDGVNTMEEYFARAKAWGHRGIAVTDHGSVQSFPELFHLVKDSGMKALYGLELVLADDEAVRITRGRSEELLSDATYVVFDIETTGLSVVYDALIEIAGVKIKNGTIVGEFSTFVDPERPINQFTTDLTGITMTDVRGKPKPSEAVASFLTFAGDAILVAHNADFDLGHVYAVRKHDGIDEPEHASVDTLTLAKALWPDRQRYSLDSLCKLLKVNLNGHHRAINDAKATAEVFLHMLKELRNRSLNRFADIELALDRANLYKIPYPHHVNFIVKNQEGLKNLYKILSEASTTYFDRDAKITKSFVEKHRKGLLIGSGCRNSKFFETAMTKTKDELRAAARFFDYLEIQPPSTFAYMTRTLSNWSDVIQDVMKKIVEVGRELSIPVVATGDVHHLDPEDRIFREVMIATPLVGGGGFHKLNAETEKPSQHFMTTEEMLAEFRFLGETTANEIVVANTNLILDTCDDIAVFPKALYEPKDDFLADQGVPSIAAKVERMVTERTRKLYGDPLPGIVQGRLDKELSSIIKNKFATIYYISHLLVKKSLDDGYLVGSRGSVGSSFVATMMGITEVNPLPPHYLCPKCRFAAFKKTDEERQTNGETDFEAKHRRVLDHADDGWDLPAMKCPVCGTDLVKDGHDIPFETFLGFKGDKVPDIDLNFSGDNQGEIHQYIRKLFGENYAFRAGTIGTCAAKTAFAMVRDFYEKQNEARAAANQPPIRIRRAEMERLAKGIEGSKRTSGQHPGGIVVVPNDREIYDITPIQYPGDSTDTTWKTTHFEYHSFESNLFKLDVLGHDDPTMIRYLMDLVKKDPLSFPFSDPKDIPVDDPAVYRLLNGTEAIGLQPEDIMSDVASYGIPEFGTNFVRGMLRESRPQNFAQLVKISGLSHGTDVWSSNSQDLLNGRKKEFGRIDFKDLIGCRDDIMIDLIGYGMQPPMAFEIMEFVRKGKAPANPEKWGTYADQMRQAKVPEWYIWSCSKIKYMFPKAHATAYVLMAMRIAWFKLYSPIHFYSAYFSKRAAIFDVDAFMNGEYAIKARLQSIKDAENATDRDQNLAVVLELALEMVKRGFRFAPIDIHRSDASNFQIGDDRKSLVMPFTVVDSLGMNVASSILEARKDKPFVSKQDVRTRTKLSKTLFDRLEDLGVFKDMVEDVQMSLFDL
ncbi:MAG: PolC-type DNA polymerase III [Candidatus Izemoplasmatales bacterium]